MSTRILEAKYTSPSGNEAAFKYENLTRETELKTGIFVFPNRDGAHVQHHGMGARSFPIVCIFSGNSCLDDADAFENMLIERGVGELQIPYGTIKVVPTGNIKRDDDFVDGINQSIVAVTFTETITDENASVLDAVEADELKEQFDEFSDLTSVDFAEGIDTENLDEQLQVKSALESQTQSITDNLEPLAKKDKKTFADWLASAKELKDNINRLYKKSEETYVTALNIARLTLRIMQKPSDAAISLSEKISGYSKLTAVLINQYKNDPFGTEKIKKAFATARFSITGAVASVASGSALNVARSAGTHTASMDFSDTGTGTASREEAVDAAGQVVALFEDASSFCDEKVERNVFIDSDSSTYLALKMLTENSVKLIMDSAFSLPMQRTIKLHSDRQMIELCAELYGSVENVVLDRFIAENNLNIDEIELIPSGREVSYYVKST